MLWLRSERQADETEPRGGSGLLRVVLDNDSRKPGRDKTWRQCREGKKQPLKPFLGALLSEGILAVGARVQAGRNKEVPFAASGITGTHYFQQQSILLNCISS